ncbi:MAG: hypothetical protein U0469_01630 [Candidatus Paceibacterota bacterium]
MRNIFLFFVFVIFIFSCRSQEKPVEASEVNPFQDQPYTREPAPIIPNDTIVWIAKNMGDSIVFFTPEKEKVKAYIFQGRLVFSNETKKYLIYLDPDAEIFYAGDTNGGEIVSQWLEDDDYEMSKNAKPTIIMGMASSEKAQKLWDERKKFLIETLLRELKKKTLQNRTSGPVFFVKILIF